MAIIDKETLFNTENLNGAKWSFGVPLERTNPVPIDKWSTFKTYADAVKFVNRATGNIAYPGQIITIEGPDNVVDVYVVDRTATDCLKKLASGGSAEEIANRVRELSSQLLSDDGIIDQLSGAISSVLSDYTTSAQASAIASAYAKNAVSNITADISSDVSSTITKVVQTDGSVTLTSQAIQISEAQVTNLTSDLETISTAVDSKIKIQDGDNTAAENVSSVTIHKISQAKYVDLLKNNGIVDTDLYVVSSDSLDAFGERVTNVADAEAATDAVNLKQLISAISEARNEADNKVTALSNELLSVGGIKDQLSNAISGVAKDYTTSAQASTIAQNVWTSNVSNLTAAEQTFTGATVISSIKEENGIVSVGARSLSVSELCGYADLIAANAVTLSAAAGTGGILSAYTIKQGETTIGTIEIPKDKVVENGKVVRGSLSGETFISSDAKDAPYFIELTIANNENKKVYVPVPEIVDAYKGHDGTTVKVTIDNDDDGARCIHAEVKEASIEQKHLTGLFVFDCGNAQDNVIPEQPA